MSSLLGTLGIKLDGDTGDFSSALDASIGKIQDLEKAAKDLGVKFGLAFAGMGAALAYALEQTDETQMATAKLQAAIGNKSGFDTSALTEYASELSELTTFSGSSALAAEAALARYASGSDQIKAVLPAVADLAAALGIDLPQAARLMGQASQNGSASLVRMGISMSSAQRAALDALPSHERLAAAAQLIEENFGGVSAELSNTFGGSLKQAGKAIDNVAEAFGDIFKADAMSILHSLTQTINDIAAAFGDLNPQTQTLVKYVGYAAAGFTGLVTAAAAAVVTISSVVASATSLGIIGTEAAAAAVAVDGLAVAETAAGVAADVAFAPLLVTFAAVAAAIAGVALLVGALSLAWKSNLGGMTDAVKGWLTNTVSWFTEMIDSLTKSWQEFANWFSEKAILVGTFVSGGSADDAASTISAMHESGQNLLSTGSGSGASDMFQSAASTAGDIGSGIFDGLKASANETASILKGLWGSATSLLPANEHLATKVTAAGNSADKFSGVVARVWDEAATEAQGLNNQFNTLLQGVEGTTASMATLMNNAQATADTITGFGSGVHDAVAEYQLQLEDQNKAIKALDEQRIKVEQTLIDSLYSLASNLGNGVDTIIQAFAEGGAIAGLTAIFSNLFQRTEAFARITEQVGEILDTLSGVLEPVGEAAEPLIEVIGQMASVLTTVLTPILKAMVPVFELYADVQGVVVKAIAYVIKGIATVWNGIISAISSVFHSLADISIWGWNPFGFLDDVGDAIDSAKIDTEALDDAINGYEEAVEDTADDAESSSTGQTMDEFKEAMKGFTRTTEETSDSLEEVNQSLSNAPEGFKDSIYRFNATVASTIADLTKIALGRESTSTTSITVNSNDAEHTARVINTIAERKALVTTGSTQASSNKYSTMKRVPTRST